MIKALEKEIIEYLKSKGIIKACLYHKLIKRFCSKNSKFKVKKDELVSCIISLFKQRKVEIIIPVPFDVVWIERKIKGFIYLNEGIYTTRIFKKLNENYLSKIQDMWYLFDSRKLNLNNPKEVKNAIFWLKNVIKKISNIKYKLIIFYPINSKNINIYEPLEDEFKLSFGKIRPLARAICKKTELKIDVETQKQSLAIIKAYRHKYMCFYIILIESIHYAIIEIQNRKKTNYFHKKKINEFIEKFGYYSTLFVKSDWVNVTDPNPYRWETFFISFRLPLKILDLEIKAIRFHKSTFETLDRYRYCIFIEKKRLDVINKLKKYGYEEFKDVSTEKHIAIGLDIEIFLPCSSIEHFFFIAKYICFYHLFLLYYHSFDYIKERNPEIKFNNKEKMIFKTFFPVMNSLFKISNHKPSKMLVFKFYTLNPEELEIIYNQFLIPNVKHIENKMFKYHFLRLSLKKEEDDSHQNPTNKRNI